MPSARPSLDLLRSLSDEHVLRALFGTDRITRAELATRTGLSKPTVAESVRRLTAAGLIYDTGERTHTRGGVGTYYALAPNVGSAVAVQIAPEGVVAEALDAHGSVLARAEEPVPRPASQAVVTRLVRRAARTVVNATDGPARLAVVSAADPVERRTGRLVRLPDAPFLVGDLSPVDALRPLVAGQIIVDNDVNWAARAERAASAPTATPDDFAYLYLGEGLGCAVVSNGEVVRGHGGLAGEISHILTTGTNRQAVPFTEVFAQLGLRHREATSVDVEHLLGAIRTKPEVALTLARAVAGVLTAIVALSDPEAVVLGGAWGSDPILLEIVQSEFGQYPRAVPLRAALPVPQPALAGARQHALSQLRAALIEPTRFPAPPDAVTTAES